MVLCEAGISREHAIFQDDGRTLTVSDVASTNGTFVNGEQIRQPTSLQEGDVIAMGGCELEFVGRKPQSEFPSYRDTRENIPIEVTRDAGRYVARRSPSTDSFKKMNS
jgi:pSer/pThr/pTyr-binding forkhead associated (FHA) protein